MQVSTILVTVAASVAFVSVVAGQQPGRQPEATFRVQVDAVEFDAVVTDARGRVVTDLTVDDFEVLEDGKPQTIVSFALVQVPVERAPRPLFPLGAAATDVQANNRGEGRLYVIALDDVTPDQALRTRRFVHRFVEQYFAANDLGAVFFLGRGGRTANAQGLTNDPRRLLAAVDSFSGGFPDDPVPTSPVPQLGAAPPRAPINERDLAGRRSLGGLRNVVEFMASVHGRRKALLLFTEGFSVDMFRVADYRGGVLSLAEEDAHKAIAEATRSSISIYPVDPRGLMADGGTADDQSSVALGDSDRLDAAAAALSGVGNLQALASVTGGFAVTNTNRFENAFKSIAEQNSIYYVLGFASTNDRRDGRYRRVQVRVKRPGLRVQARDGYVAPLGSERPPAPRPSPSTMSLAVADALRSPVAVDGVPVRVFAAPYKGTSHEATVALAVEVDASKLGLTEANGGRLGTLEVSYLAIDNRNKLYPGKTVTEKLALKPETYDRVARSGLRTLAETRLPPGRYQIRVAAGNGAGRSGSVVYDLDVPDFTKGALVLSGISVGSSSVSKTLTVRLPTRFSGALAGALTASREFDRGDSLSVYAEAYENVKHAAIHIVEFSAELRAEDGRIVRQITGERSSTGPDSESGYKFAADLPLGDVAAGVYAVHVEARSTAAGHPVASRELQIRVR
jgi:VWFA-related protein